MFELSPYMFVKQFSDPMFRLTYFNPKTDLSLYIYLYMYMYCLKYVKSMEWKMEKIMNFKEIQKN